MKPVVRLLPDHAATENLGYTISRMLTPGVVVYLEGELGAGKTTLTRGLLAGFGHSGTVKSPTYTLVEQYEFEGFTVYHFDLYRLADPEELDYMGIRDYFTGSSVAIIEWPARGAGFVATPDLVVRLEVERGARRAYLQSHSAKGLQLLEELTHV